jgi:hypothetical protein
MAALEELMRGAAVRGILPDGLVTVVDRAWYGSSAGRSRPRAGHARCGAVGVIRVRYGATEAYSSSLTSVG